MIIQPWFKSFYNSSQARTQIDGLSNTVMEFEKKTGQDLEDVKRQLSEAQQGLENKLQEIDEGAKARDEELKKATEYVTTNTEHIRADYAYNKTNK